MEMNMFFTQPIQSNIQSSFSSEQSVPLLEAFDRASMIMKKQQTSIGKIQNDFDDYVKSDSNRKAEIKKDLLIELATKADIEILNGKIDTLRAEMNGHINSLRAEMNGHIDSLKNEMLAHNNENLAYKNEMQGSFNSLKNEMLAFQNEMIGEFKSIRLWIKMLVALTFFAATFYSPTAQLLIKMFK